LAGAVGRKDLPIMHEEIDWQPASRYRLFWPHMKAFAIPSFYDGRLRVNLLGRERYGVVSPNRYYELISEIKSLLHDCIDPLTSEPVVEEFHQPSVQPADRSPTEADLCVHWRGLPTGMQHPKYGKIGPIPYRRTGGHSGPRGFLYYVGSGLSSGDYGD